MTDVEGLALLEHLYGLPSLGQTHRDIEVNAAYRWFPGYDLLEKISHFATVSYAFCRRFPPELSEEIFAHILNKPVFITGGCRMSEDFSRQTRRFSAAILTDCKGNQRSMAGKRPPGRRSPVVNTGSALGQDIYSRSS